jgi:hypothetical protein
LTTAALVIVEVEVKTAVDIGNMVDVGFEVGLRQELLEEFLLGS